MTKLYDLAGAKKRMEEDLERFLREACLRALAAAYSTKEYADKSYNLSDSFAAAIYKDGVLIPDTMAFMENQKAVSGKKWYGSNIVGHQAAREYLTKYKPRSKGYSLVVIAAMPYYDILEKGRGGLRNKYKVITGANSFMRDLAKEIDAKFGGRRKQGTTLIRFGI